MKAIVFSDSHDRVSLMEDLTKKYLSRIDCIIHLGDCTEDTAALRELGKPLFQVRGNNDYDSLYPLERTVSLAGKRIYMTHGHRQKVYWNTDVLYYTAAQEQADAALFGHTHVPYLENEGGIIIMNPGSISLPRGGNERTFGFLTIEGGKITASVMEYSREGIRKIKSL